MSKVFRFLAVMVIFEMISVSTVHGNERVTELIRQLRDSSVQVNLNEDRRSLAAVDLIGCGESAVAPLIKALGDKDAGTRRRAAWVLGELRAAPAARGLAGLLHDRDGFVRSAAGEALSRIGAPAVEPLLEVMAPVPSKKKVLVQKALPKKYRSLSGGDATTRLSAINALGRIGDARAMHVLSEAVTDGDPETRVRAVWALGKVRSPTGVPGLMTAIRSDDARTRELAVWALNEIGTPAITNLMSVFGDENSEARTAAAQALGKIGAESVPELLGTLSSPSAIKRATAAYSLGLIGVADVKTLVPLLPLLKDEDVDVRAKAAFAVARCAGADAPKLLKEAISDQNPLVRKYAAQGLGEAKCAAAIDVLAKLLNDDDAGVRHSIVIALGLIGEKEAVLPVIGALKDKDGRVRHAATVALRQLKDDRAIDTLIAALGDDWLPVAYAANAALCDLTGHNIIIPTDWYASTIRQYIQPKWIKWRENNDYKKNS